MTDGTHATRPPYPPPAVSPTGAVLCAPNLYTMTAGHDMYLCYLPLAHIMELAVEVTLLYAGCCLGYGSPARTYDQDGDYF